MDDVKVFTVEIEVHERPAETEAKALLDIDGDIRGGWGQARRDRGATPRRPEDADDGDRRVVDAARY